MVLLIGEIHTQDKGEGNKNDILNLALRYLLSGTSSSHLILHYLLCTVGPGRWMPINQYL